MIKRTLFIFFLCYGNLLQAQLTWVKVDSLFGRLPASVHVYRTTDSLDGKPNIAYYLEANLKDKSLEFTTDTTRDRRLTPQKFYERNNHPVVTVNCTFFSYETNRSLNTVVKDGKLVGYNIHSVPGKGKDTLTYRHPLGSAIGISKERKADVAWLLTDSAHPYPYALQNAIASSRDSIQKPSFEYMMSVTSLVVGDYSGKHGKSFPQLKKWRTQTAVGGGPVLLQNGEIRITNEEEIKFAGKAINDRHPRTAMGYTKDHKLIILVIQGRFPGIAEGATLTQEARILKNIGCREALNLDGGGSSCMLVNGRETIKPSDKEGQRPVPAVFLVESR
ncbi:MAG: phosphodiester glycosidase family protein [Bacteroidota bacterium]|nr:phosphodiester glycosidase family protein [Bacteroidota bacterium]